MGIRDTYSLTMIILFVITFGMYIHSPVLAQSDNMAVQGSNTMAGSTGFNNITNLGAPLFIEYYKIISDKKLWSMEPRQQKQLSWAMVL